MREHARNKNAAQKYATYRSSFRIHRCTLCVLVDCKMRNVRVAPDFADLDIACPSLYWAIIQTLCVYTDMLYIT